MSTNNVGCWIVVHYRAYDMLYYGPFESPDAAIKFCSRMSKHGLRGQVIPITSPNVDPKHLFDDVSGLSDAIWQASWARIVEAEKPGEKAK